MVKWTYLVVEVSNMGRTVFENGILVKSHTKKADLTKLSKSLWNSKGKEMMHEAKGDILNNYGAKGWELVSAEFGEHNENKYVFKQK
tara:strand:+ start:304 stop:564 length:261 start_codon:yes stop_codon:yes gene_type:complete